MDAESRRMRLINGTGMSGLALVAVGCWLVSPATACVVVGALLFGLSIWASLRVR